MAHIDHGVDAGTKKVAGIGHKQGPQNSQVSISLLTIFESSWMT
jgi:hypothetical protein